MENNELIIPEDDADFKLIKSYIEGDEKSFSILVHKHKDKVRNLVYLTLGDVDFIDDISQDVFINVYHKIKEFRFESKFTTWLYRITINKCHDYLRKKKVRSIFVSIEDNYDKHSSGMRTESQDIIHMMRKAIEKLPEKLKEPLIMRDIDGYSYKEIADFMNCEVGTIKSRIFRARETLKIFLEPYQKEMRF